MAKIALVTCEREPDLAADDRLLLEPLKKEGVESVPMRWEDPAADWSAFDAVVLRSPWDYYLRVDAFSAWLDRIASLRVLNPVPVVRWNLHKQYLVELAGRGVPVVPTELVRAGSNVSLAEVMRARGWDEAVVKPAVSAGGHQTFIVRATEAEGAVSARFSEMRARMDVLVQPMLREIVAEGEWSFVFFDGEFSHALVKRPAAGNFLVQPSHGGSMIQQPTPPRELLEAATAILRAAPFAEPPLYARVDGVVSGGKLLLMELELIEPVLFFTQNTGSAERFARAVARRLGLAGAGKP